MSQTRRINRRQFLKFMLGASVSATGAALGGSVLRDPFDIPGGPTLAWIADPEGNRITLVQQ